MAILCPRCRKPMVARQRAGDGHPFYGCSDYPTCRGTRPMRQDLNLIGLPDHPDAHPDDGWDDDDADGGYLYAALHDDW